MDFIDNQVYVPLRVFFSMYGSDRSVTVAVRAGSEERLPEVRLETIGLMRQIRNLRPDEPIDFSLNESQAFRDSIAQIRLTVWGVGIGMTVLSFIVGIIGIMNIMLVSVTERTREIGIRKALGATYKNILLQFIIEAVVIGVTGGLLGIFLGVVGARLVSLVAGWNTVISYIAIFGAFTISVMIGLFFGIYPARKAALLDPIDALRYE